MSILVPFFGNMSSFLLGKDWLRMELLGHRLDMYLTFLEAAKQFSNMRVQFCTLTTSVWELHFFHIFTSIWFHQSFFKALWADVKWHLLMVFICIFLMITVLSIVIGWVPLEADSEREISQQEDFSWSVLRLNPCDMEEKSMIRQRKSWALM